MYFIGFFYTYLQTTYAQTVFSKAKRSLLVDDIQLPIYGIHWESS